MKEIDQIRPNQIPKNLTRLSALYTLKTSLAVLAIILFFALYFGLVYAFYKLTYLSVIFDIVSVNKFTILAKLGAIAGSAMLFVFTLKFIFKFKNHKFENRIKLNKKDNPELIQFIHQICDETGAPKPKSIYLDPDVNAYVAYSNTWLSLILPVRKDLTIGLGLVEALNLSEFKAVISHEFGHFAQKSMKVGSYILSANTIIHGMIFERDKWDDALDSWKQADFRLSAAAWVITPIIWLIRQALRLFYLLLNITYSSLSREMEFNADKVAVKTSGSEAIVSSLWKLDKAFIIWNEVMNNVYLASQKNLFVRNIYKHYHLAFNRSQSQLNDELKQLPIDDLGQKTYFSKPEYSQVSMYASHPSNDAREKNAKSPFVACKTNENSSWSVFENHEKIQEELTTLIYKQYFNQKVENYISESEFEKFIEEEGKGKELMEAYHNTFTNRFVQIPEDDQLHSISSELNWTEARKELLDQLAELMKPVQELEQLLLEIQQIANGTIKKKNIEYKGKSYNKKEQVDLYNKIFEEREKLFSESFTEWDNKFCSLHLYIAELAGKQSALKSLYNQHKNITKFYKTCVDVRNSIYESVNRLQNAGEVPTAEISGVSELIVQKIIKLNTKLLEWDKNSFLPLTNIDSLRELQEAITPNAEFPLRKGPIFENGGFQIIVQGLEQAIGNCQRVEQKSIAQILSTHEELKKELEVELT